MGLSCVLQGSTPEACLLKCPSVFAYAPRGDRGAPSQKPLVVHTFILQSKTDSEGISDLAQGHPGSSDTAGTRYKSHDSCLSILSLILGEI